MDPPYLRNLVEAFAVVRATTDVGGEALDREAVERLANGVDGLFRNEVGDRYPGWPPGSTTDGAVPYLCWRNDDRRVQLVGMAYLDFDGSVFPFRAEFALDAEEKHTSVEVFIGQVDERTGEPPKLPSTSLIAVVRDDDGTPLSTDLITRRRQAPITWTSAVRWTNHLDHLEDQ